MSGNYPAGVTDNDPHFDLPSVEDEPDEWIFTFGFAHVHPETGESLANCYVVIPDLDVNESRELMNERFGNKWAFQYPSRKAAGVEKWNLREILLPESDDEEPHYPSCTCPFCGRKTTRDPIYGDLCSKCCSTE